MLRRHFLRFLASIVPGVVVIKALPKPTPKFTGPITSTVGEWRNINWAVREEDVWYGSNKGLPFPTMANGKPYTATWGVGEVYEFPASALPITIKRNRNANSGRIVVEGLDANFQKVVEVFE